MSRSEWISCAAPHGAAERGVGRFVHADDRSDDRGDTEKKRPPRPRDGLLNSVKNFFFGITYRLPLTRTLRLRVRG
jgi:hypothetical protein